MQKKLNILGAYVSLSGEVIEVNRPVKEVKDSNILKSLMVYMPLHTTAYQHYQNQRYDAHLANLSDLEENNKCKVLYKRRSYAQWVADRY